MPAIAYTEITCSFVWLVAVMTNDADAAATRIQVVVLGETFPGRDDMAKGTWPTKHRYVFAWPNPEENKKITSVMLWRSFAVVENPPAGWDLISSDINVDRMPPAVNDHLCIIAKTASA